MYANRRNFRTIEEIGVEKYDGDVRFKCGSGYMAVLCMRNAPGHNYRKSSFIVDLAVGQIPQNVFLVTNIIVNIAVTIHYHQHHLHQHQSAYKRVAQNVEQNRPSD